MKIDMNSLKVVFDYVGKYKNVISMMMNKDRVEREFVILYNVYCDLVNPRYEIWNAQWNLEHELTENEEKEYLEFIKAKQEACIRENESLFKSGIFKSVFISDDGTFSAYVNDKIGTFLISFHLENK